MSKKNLIVPPTHIIFASIDVSRHILVVDISVLAKSNLGRREYKSLCDLDILSAQKFISQKK
jgi:hypothetical protein